MDWGSKLDTIAAPRARARLRLAYFLPGGVLVATGMLLFGSTGRDDAYITYWPAETLARSGKLLNYNGARLEQSSSLLHTVVLAIVSKLTTLPVPATGWLVGVAGGVLVVGIAVVIAERLEPGAGWRAGLLVATSAYLVYWSFGGLETSLAAASFLIALLALDATLRRARPFAISVLGVLPYVLARPEAPVILLAICAASLAIAAVARRGAGDGSTGEVRAALHAGAAVVVAAIVVVGFRVAYFGDVVPQPVHTKVNGLRLGDGINYARHWLVRPDALLLIAFVVFTFSRRRRNTLEVLLWIGAGPQMAFVVATGGDWMEAGRFLVPFLSLVAILAGVGTTRVRPRTTALAVLVMGQLVGVLLVARTDSTGRPLWASFSTNPAVANHVQLPRYEALNRVHVRDGAFEPRLLEAIDAVHRETGRTVVVASGQAGMVIYDVLHARPGIVQFIDRGRLSGDAFGGCTAGLVDTPFGRAMPFAYWFAHADQCAVQLPDVAFDLGDGRDLGPQFVVTDVLRSPKIVAKGRLRGAPTDATEFVAIRSDLAAAQPK